MAERLGIGHQVLRGRNERLVYASISGFGQDGPRAQRPAYDLVVQAATGLMSINGAADGPPMIVGEAFGDLVAGLLCILGNPGCGGSARRQRQELPYRRCDVRHLAVHDAHGNRQLPGEWTAASPCRQSPSAVSTIRCLAAGDDSVVIAVLGNRQFEAFADVIQRPDLLHDGRFASDEGHCPHEADLRVAIEGWSRQRSVAHVVEEPGAAGIACAAIGAMAWPAGRSPGMRSLLGYLGQGRRHGRLP